MSGGEFVPPDFIVKCDTCERPLSLCGKRPGGRKYDIGGSYRCVDCQDATDVEPRFDERYAS